MRLSFKDFYDYPGVLEWVNNINITAISSKSTNKKYLAAVYSALGVNDKNDIEYLSILYLGKQVEKKGAQPSYVYMTSEICKDDADFSVLVEKGWLFSEDSLNGKDKSRYDVIGDSNYRIYKDAEVSVLMIRAIRMLIDLGKENLLENSYFEYEKKQAISSGDINVAIKPSNIYQKSDINYVVCPLCGNHFIKAPRCPECGQKILYV